MEKLITTISKYAPLWALPAIILAYSAGQIKGRAELDADTSRFFADYGHKSEVTAQNALEIQYSDQLKDKYGYQFQTEFGKIKELAKLMEVSPNTVKIDPETIAVPHDKFLMADNKDMYVFLAGKYNSLGITPIVIKDRSLAMVLAMATGKEDQLVDGKMPSDARLSAWGDYQNISDDWKGTIAWELGELSKNMKESGTWPRFFNLLAAAAKNAGDDEKYRIFRTAVSAYNPPRYRASLSGPTSFLSPPH